MFWTVSCTKPSSVSALKLEYDRLWDQDAFRDPVDVLIVEVMEMSRDTAVLYVKDAFPLVESVVMDDEIRISGVGASIMPNVPEVTDSSTPRNRKIVPVTT